MLNTGDFESNKISNHNDINPKKKIAIIKLIIDKIAPHLQVNKILNLGCGLGFETKALSEVYNSDVTGIDLSVEGIKFEKK